jgi:pimeloyl-ACP methyl ester carboxylesterase
MSGMTSDHTSQGEVQYAERGAGPPVLYFHGFGVGADAILSIEHRLTESGFRLIVPNRPGYYGTRLSSDATSHACAALFSRLLDALHLERVAVIGSSGGGFYASRFAALYPARTSCLVLECANMHPWDDARWLPAHSRWMLPLLRRPLLRQWLVRAFRMQLRFAKPLGQLKQSAGDRFRDVQDDPAAIEFCRFLLDSMRQCLQQPAGFSNDFGVIVAETGIETGTIRCPTLIIHDELDPIAPIENVQWAMQRIPCARWLNVHTAGHYIWIGPDAEQARSERLQFLQTHSR